MTDELKLAMDNLDLLLRLNESGSPIMLSANQWVVESGAVAMAALREREQAIEQARKDEREAMYDMVQREDSRSLTGVSAHDPLRRLMDAIRARGER